MCAREPTATAAGDVGVCKALRELRSVVRSLNFVAPSASAKMVYAPRQCLMPCVTAPPLPRFWARVMTRMEPGGRAPGWDAM